MSNTKVWYGEIWSQETKDGRRYEQYPVKISNRSEALKNLYNGVDIKEVGLEVNTEN
jgi:hypothetical protein